MLDEIIARTSPSHVVNLLNSYPDLGGAKFKGMNRFVDENHDRCVRLKFELTNGKKFFLTLAPQWS